MATSTTNEVWRAIEQNMFAVLGMTTAKNESRTAGVVYIVRNRKLYIGSEKEAWKVRHVAQNPHVSITVTIPKQIFFMPWVKIPAATITFSGVAKVLSHEEIDPEIQQALHKGMEVDDEFIAATAVIEVEPIKHFVTYGVGVPLMAMRDPEKASGRVAVAA